MEKRVLDAQRLRVAAFRCIRGAHKGASDQRGQALVGHALHKEMELGSFGQIGLVIGSPPTTPPTERTMRDWADEAVEMEAEVAASIRKAARDAHNKTPSLLTTNMTSEHIDPEELRALLLADVDAPARRTSLSSLEDVLIWHGLPRETFELDTTAKLAEAAAEIEQAAATQGTGGAAPAASPSVDGAGASNGLPHHAVLPNARR